jgi:hypothetical protein
VIEVRSFGNLEPSSVSLLSLVTPVSLGNWLTDPGASGK